MKSPKPLSNMVESEVKVLVDKLPVSPIISNFTMDPPNAWPGGGATPPNCWRSDDDRNSWYYCQDYKGVWLESDGQTVWYLYEDSAQDNDLVLVQWIGKEESGY